jgi:hypothetical protein
VLQDPDEQPEALRRHPEVSAGSRVWLATVLQRFPGRSLSALDRPQCEHAGPRSDRADCHRLRSHAGACAPPHFLRSLSPRRHLEGGLTLVAAPTAQDTPAASDLRDRFLVKAATPPAGDVDEVAFWKTEAARTAAATSKKFAVTLVEKLVEADEEGTETEDDTTSSIILPRKIVPAAAAAAAAAAAPPHSPARVGSSAAPQAGSCRQHSRAAF